MSRPPLTIEEKHSIATSLIHAAQQIIFTEGLANVTLRKVSKLANVNTAILYRHFSDLDELLLFASIDLLKEMTQQYVERKKSTETTEPFELYMQEWRLFCQSSFQHPECINHVFFGRHSHRLDTLLQDYYELFADELTHLGITLDDLQYCGNLYSTNYLLLTQLLGSQTDKNALNLLNDVIISYFHQLLLQKLSAGDSLDDNLLIEKMLYACRTLLHWATQEHPQHASCSL